jgi:hypothetical protein
MSDPKPSTPELLLGAGWHRWKAWIEGDDIKAEGIGTVFGGGDDDEDNSVGFWDNPVGPHTPGVSLPTGRILGTRGSPFPPVPQNTLVKVYNPRNGKSVEAPVVDEGPTVTDQGDTGHNGGAMIDLAFATAKFLGISSDSCQPVEIRILGGAKYVTAAQIHTSAPDPHNVDPSDAALLAEISVGLHKMSKPPYDMDAVRDLIMKLKSGCIQDLLVTLDAHLDLAENAGDSENNQGKVVAEREFKSALASLDSVTARFKSAHSTTS